MKGTTRMGLGLALFALNLAAISPPGFAADEGAQLFASKACIYCHVLDGDDDASGTMGPDLSDLYQATPPRDPKKLAAFIQNPWAKQPDGAMPTIGLTPEEAKALAAFILTPPGPTGQR